MELPAWHPTSALEEERRRHQFGIDLVIANTNSRNANTQNSSFLPLFDAIADTIKSFFPASAEASYGAMQFQSFPTLDLVSRNGGGSSSQDLRLSLQSFQDSILLHHHSEQPQPQPQTQVLLCGTPLGLDGWPEHHQFQRLAAWNGGGDEYLLNVPPAPSQNQFVSQRGPLQSSNTPSICVWMDPSIDHPPINPSSIGFASGFYIPARIQGDEEEHDGYSDKPSSASSDSRY
ncbi:transcription factor TCP4-like [Salvia miltiorrhiza]|uniref:transcription factor TCP4-like n=1 Tax=Salvia miltiorrhiza TaxID=226208 RepID=UPI0025AC1606|nr:transcription factor TCP4-like [Salvia miltiorrhiza]